MSVHDAGSELAWKTWNGEYLGKDGALALGLAQYQRDRKQVPFGSTLYSALGRLYPPARRGDRVAMRAVLWCLWHLQPLVSHWKDIGTNFSPEEVARSYEPPECDVISSILLRWSQFPWTSGLYVAAANTFALAAAERTKNETGGHTAALAYLTLGRIALERGRRASAQLLINERKVASRYLDQAIYRVAIIQDLNQRSRVYRGIAEVAIGVYGHSELGEKIARTALEEADAVPNIGEDVKAKNIEMRKHLKL